MPKNNVLAKNPAIRTKVIDQILGAVRRGKTFFLSGHEKPDGDTVGSELAFASFLRRQKKSVDIYNREPVPVSLLFLPGADKIKSAVKVEKNYDVAVVFECSGQDRMGNVLDLKRQAKTVINIDHHAHHNFFGDINLINPKASSNSEQLFFLFERAKVKITKDEAAALYVGLVTDTGRFQQENANWESHIVASGLHKTGIDVADICRRVFSTRSPAALKLLSRALASLRLEFDNKVAVMTLSRNDFEETGATGDDTEDVINHGLMVPTVQAVVFAKETDRGDVKMSFRGKGLVDLMQLAVEFGGGGHKNASGCSVAGPLAAAMEKVMPKLSERLP